MAILFNITTEYLDFVDHYPDDQYPASLLYSLVLFAHIVLRTCMHIQLLQGFMLRRQVLQLQSAYCQVHQGEFEGAVIITELRGCVV